MALHTLLTSEMIASRAFLQPSLAVRARLGMLLDCGPGKRLLFFLLLFSASRQELFAGHVLMHGSLAVETVPGATIWTGEDMTIGHDRPAWAISRWA